MTSGGGVGGQAIDVAFIDVVARSDERSLRQMEQQVADASTAAGERGGAGLKGAMGTALASLPGLAVAAATAVGVAFVGGLTAAVGIAQQVNQGILDIRASTGATAEEATALGEVAKKVFGNNWGQDLAAAQQAVINVRKEVKGLSDTDLQAVTEGSIAISERFEEDQSKVAAAVQSLMKSTGQSATEALDFISAGFQRGLNTSGDFLDTLNEYAPQFEKAKISGSDLFSLLETGTAKGALGTDKVADAFKEFGLTLVDVSDDSKAVYAELGLSQDDLTKRVNEGSLTQAQAFQLVTDRLKGVQGVADRTRIAAAIFGGAGEDFGPGLTQLDITKTKLDDVKGSTKLVQDATNTFQSVFQTAWRQTQLALEPAGQELLKLATDAMPTITAALGQLGPLVTQVVTFLVQGFQKARATVEEFSPAIDKGLSVVRPVVTAFGQLFLSTFNLVGDLWNGVLKPTIIALLPVVTTVFNGIASVVGVALTTVTNIVNAVSALLRGDWSQAWQFLAGAVVGALDGIEKFLTDFLPKMVASGDKLAQSLIDGMQKGLDGLQAMILQALANALGTLGDNLPPILQPLAEKLATAAQEAADRNRPADITLKKLGPAGPSLQDIISPTPTSGTISGQELVAALGLAGNRTGTPFGGKYFGGQIHNGEDLFGPVGTKLLAPFTGLLTTRWSETTGRILELVDQTGQKLLLGHLEGFKGSLKGLPEDIQAAFRAAKGGPIAVEQGTVIGSIGQTGTLAHADIKGNAHLHLMAYDKDGNIFDPKTAKFVPIEDTEQARAVVAKKTGSSTATYGGAAGTGATITVPLPTAAEQAEYNFKLADYLKIQTTVLGYAAELRAAEEAHNTELVQRIQERIDAYTKDSKARAGAIEFAKKVLADRAAIEADADKKEEETDLQRDQRIRREQTAQQKLTADIRAAGEERLNTIIKTGVTSENSLAKINAAEAELARRGQLTQQAAAQAKAARIADQKTADAEEEARDKRVASNRLAAERALAAGQIDLAQRKASEVIGAYNREIEAAGTSAEDKLAVEKRLGENVLAARNLLAKTTAEAEVNRLKIERNAAVNAEGLTLKERQGLWVQYGQKIQQVNDSLTTTVSRNAEDSTQKLLGIQIAAGAAASAINDQQIAAANAQFKNLEANADFAQRQIFGQDDEGLLRSLRAATGFSILQIRYDVEGALAEARRLAPQTAAVIERVYSEQLAHRREVGAAEREESAATAKAEQENYATTRQFLLDTLGARSEEGLLRVYDQAVATRDTDLIARTLAEIEKRILDSNARLNVALIAQSEASARAIADIAQGERDSEAEATRRASNPTQELMGQLAELKAQGLDPRKSGFTQVLEDWIDLGGPAGAAAQTFKNNLNDILVLMGFVREEVDMGLAGIKANPARTPTPLGSDPFAGGVTYEDTPVAPNGARPKLTPDQQAAAAKNALPVDPRKAKELGDAWAAMLSKLEDSDLIAETAARMKLLSNEQLEAAKGAAFLAQNVPEYTAALAEQSARAAVGAESLKLMADAQAELDAAGQEALPGYELRARALEQQAALDEENAESLYNLAQAIRDVGQASAENAEALNITVKIGGIDSGLKQLDVLKGGLMGVADVVSKTFESLVDGSEVSAQSVVKSMAIMALGIVKQVAVAIVAYQAQAIAVALLSGATFNFVQAGLALVAAAAIAGVVAGLQSRLGAAAPALASPGSVGTTPNGISSTPAGSVNNQVTIPTGQVTVAATPEAFAVFGRHVDRFGQYVQQLVGEGVRVAVEEGGGGNGGSGGGNLDRFGLLTP